MNTTSMLENVASSPNPVDAFIKAQPKVLILPKYNKETERPSFIRNLFILPYNPVPQKNPNLKSNRTYWVLENTEDGNFLHHLKSKETETVASTIYLLGHRYSVKPTYSVEFNSDKFSYAELADFGFVEIKPGILMDMV